MSMSKRQMSSTGKVLVSKKRPVGKNVINVVKATVSTTQLSTTLFTTTYPATITGLRWMIGANSIIAADTTVQWAIVKVNQGLSASNLGASDGGSYYLPEQNMITWGTAFLRGSTDQQGPGSVLFEGETKSMRKLQGGDTLQFIVVSSVANSLSLAGAVQFFTKS